VPSATVRSRAVGGKGADTGGASEARDTLPVFDTEDPEAVTMSGADLALSEGTPSIKTYEAICSECWPADMGGRLDVQGNPELLAGVVHTASPSSFRVPSTYMTKWRNASSLASEARWSQPIRVEPLTAPPESFDPPPPPQFEAPTAARHTNSAGSLLRIMVSDDTSKGIRGVLTALLSFE